MHQKRVNFHFFQNFIVKLYSIKCTLFNRSNFSLDRMKTSKIYKVYERFDTVLKNRGKIQE